MFTKIQLTSKEERVQEVTDVGAGQPRLFYDELRESGRQQYRACREDFEVEMLSVIPALYWNQFLGSLRLQKKNSQVQPPAY